MKINPSQVVAAAKSADGGLGAVLLFGPDQGLISETAGAAVAAIAGRPADPFLLTELTPGQLKTNGAFLDDEMRALPMLGGRKVVVLRDATDAIADAVAAVLSADRPPVNFLVVEAGELPPRSKLRKAFETAANAGAAGCYSDDRRGLEGLLDEVLGGHRLRIAPDARALLLARLGNDRMVSRGEMEKLALYVGEAGEIGADDVLRLVGDNVAQSIDAVVFDAADGDAPAADLSLARALDDGVAAVQILRALQRHFQRLHLVAGDVAQGGRLDAALGRLRPPVFFKLKGRFQKQCQTWSPACLAEAMELATEAERQCKQTGAPDAAICQRAVLRIAAAARRQAAR